MNSNRLFLLGALGVAGVGLGVISFGNMGENLVYFWSPTELVAAGDKAEGAIVRLGGVVEVGSLDWQTEAQSLSFKVSDGTTVVDVRATGAPPQMFREGIGVVVEGTLAGDGVFESDRLMVKHSNEYKAPVEGAATDELYKTVEEL
jgi:cytochrome c-type biogenesis protein CcmE